MQDLLLPLFPLNVVLFPGMNLALHIFEERYKQMIADCLENRWEFGVVLVQEDSLDDTGCTALVSEVVRKYDDGRMDIRVRGQRRFEILVLDRQKPYLRGAPHFFDDETGAVSESDGRRKQACELYEQVIQMLEPADSEPPDLHDARLSFQIMARLPVDLGFKQNLLENRSESERLTQVVSFLQKVVARLSLVTKTRARAGGNGQRR